MEMVNLHGQEMACICEKYNNGRNALLVGTGGYYCCASVNLPEEDMLPNEIAINNDGLCKGVLPALIEAGIVSQQIRSIRSGFVDFPVCELLI